MRETFQAFLYLSSAVLHQPLKLHLASFFHYFQIEIRKRYAEPESDLF